MNTGEDKQSTAIIPTRNVLPVDCELLLSCCLREISFGAYHANKLIAVLIISAIIMLCDVAVFFYRAACKKDKH